MTDSDKQLKEAVAEAKDLENILDARRSEAEFQADDPVPDVIEAIKSGNKDASELTPDERFVTIKYMKEVYSMSADGIARELSISRRTVFNYYRKIKEHNAQELLKTTLPELGGEIYEMGKRAMEMALAMGRPKDFAYALSMTVSTLQSIGILPKVPQRLDQRVQKDVQIRGYEGFKKLQNAANENDEITVDAVFEEIMEAVREETENETNSKES